MTHVEQAGYRNSPSEGVLSQLLSAAILLDDAVFGNIQVYNCELGGLEILVHQGFKPDFLERFSFVGRDDTSVCARAYRLAGRIAIPDLKNDPYYDRYYPVAQAAGFRSVQSTPIIDSQGCVIGMLSTHFPQIHYLSKRAQLALDVHAAAAARLLEHFFYAPA
ncbi:MAG TPA: GAF domain-containing protein [Methylophilaceae bacterium]|nr:GAF domain-containing protein [Methylophilaceae bacterium]